MSIKLVYRNDVPSELLIPKEVLPENGVPFSHHFQSTPQDNLIELAGRVCYDSCKSEKTRSSTDYHKHINDVNHGSVQEQCNLVFEINLPYDLIASVIINRPGVFLYDRDFGTSTVVANIRAIKEWSVFNSITSKKEQHRLLAHAIGDAIKYTAREICPLALSDWAKLHRDSFDMSWCADLVLPSNSDEVWLSFHIDTVSRGLSHEWVRHKFQTAISQRSTRYVDESDSEWVWHPLLDNIPTDYMRDRSLTDYCLKDVEILCKDTYNELVERSENYLIINGVDKFTARKQARGAARGVLGNSLATEMIWSGSLAQIIRIIKQRATEAADAEIRLLANELYEIVQPLYPQHFLNTEKKPCQDSIGYEVIWK
jgi:flavin-dependent thymidylate synthase